MVTMLLCHVKTACASSIATHQMMAQTVPMVDRAHVHELTGPVQGQVTALVTVQPVHQVAAPTIKLQTPPEQVLTSDLAVLACMEATTAWAGGRTIKAVQAARMATMAVAVQLEVAGMAALSATAVAAAITITTTYTKPTRQAGPLDGAQQGVRHLVMAPHLPLRLLAVLQVVAFVSSIQTRMHHPVCPQLEPAAVGGGKQGVQAIR